MKTLVDLLRTSAERYHDRPALSIRSGLRDDTWTYGRLWRASNAVAQYLRHEARLGPGDRVVFWAPNCPQLVAAYLGAMIARLVVVPLDPSSAADFIRRVVDDTGAKLVIAGFRGAETICPGGSRSLFDLPFDETSLPVDDLPSENDIAEIVFTSGTTGKPKGVMLTHRNLVTCVESASQLLPERQYRLLSLLPLSHMLEQSVGLYIPFLFGSSVAYARSRQPRVLAETMRRHHVTTIVLVPEVLELLLRHVELAVRRRGRARRWQHAHRLAPRLPMRLRRLLFRDVLQGLGGHLDFVICGGAQLSVDLAETWERMGVRVIQGYGMTECAPIVACNSYWRRHLDSVGPPAPGVLVRLSPHDEILVKGDNLTPGYWQNPEATRAAFTPDGWYQTGDLGWQDDEGNLHLQGRLRDLVVLSSGLKVHPEDVEAELRKEAAIADCIVLSLPGAHGQPEVHAVVIPARIPEGRPPGSQDLPSAMRSAGSRLAPHQRVSAFTVWPGDDFPRTSLMKVKRHEVRAALASGTTAKPSPPAGEPAAAGPGSDALSSLLARLSDRSPAAVTDEDELALDLGIDSLGLVELAMLLEEELGATIDEEALASAVTVGDLRRIIERRSGQEMPSAFSTWSLGRPALVARNLLQRAVVFPLHAAFCRPFRVTGRHALDGLEPPVLFIANHASHLDTPSVLRALPARLRGRTAVAAAADYFYQRRGIGDAMSLLLNTFPFSREGRIRSTLEHCGELVDEGWSLLVFPEGTRSPTGRLQPFRSGLRLLVQNLRVPVVPVAISGTFDALPKGSHWPRKTAVRVSLGEPIPPPAAGEVVELACYERAIAALLDESLGGIE